jgi:hypothetical protein
VPVVPVVVAWCVLCVVAFVFVVRVVVRVPVMGFVDVVSETFAGGLRVPRRRDIRLGLLAVVVARVVRAIAAICAGLRKMRLEACDGVL